MQFIQIQCRATAHLKLTSYKYSLDCSSLLSLQSFLLNLSQLNFSFFFFFLCHFISVFISKSNDFSKMSFFTAPYELIKSLSFVLCF